MGDGAGYKKIQDLDRLAKDGANVICLQEASDRKYLIVRWCEKNDWRFWYGNVPGASAVPILYSRTKVKVEKRLSRIAVPRMYVGRGSGPDWSKTKVINGIRVNNVWILNTHFIASAWMDNAAFLRKKHYQLHMLVLSRIVKRKINNGRRVLVTGDFNAEPTSELLNPLRKLGMVQHTKFPTHANRIIDLIWTSFRVATKENSVVELSSDHRASLLRERNK